MTDKELKKLNRRELLEILLNQRRQIDTLEQEVSELRAQIEDRRLAIEKVGSIAEASLALTNIFAEAQRAADLYLENVTGRASEINGAEAPEAKSDGEQDPSKPEEDNQPEEPSEAPEVTAQEELAEETDSAESEEESQPEEPAEATDSAEPAEEIQPEEPSEASEVTAQEELAEATDSAESEEEIQPEEPSEVDILAQEEELEAFLDGVTPEKWRELEEDVGEIERSALERATDDDDTDWDWLIGNVVDLP